MAKKQTGRSSSGRPKRAGASKGGTRRAAAARKAAPKKGARKTAARKAAKKTSPRKRAGAAKKTAARRAPSRGGARALKTASRGRRPSGRQVSRSTTRAKWVESPGEGADRTGQTLATRNHDVIRQWAEERGAMPATTPGGDPSDPRVLRFNFPGFGGENLQEIDWEDWFRTFDDRNLVFLYQDRMKAGNQSNFFRLDNPDREDA
jgi:hypothetical protein